MVTKLVNPITAEERLVSRIKERLGPIMLKIQHGNLEEDWRASTIEQIDDYKVADARLSQKEVCINENWIRQPPNVLVFALQRLNYDLKKHKLVKSLAKFQFEKVIYADRMLEQNQGRLSGVLLKTKEWKDDLRRLREEKAGIDAELQDNCLEKTIGRIDRKLAEMPDLASMFEYETAKKICSQLMTETLEKQKSLEAQITEVESKIANAYKDFRQLPYYLHAVLVHDGVADTGHYYSFIYDQEQSLWWRYNDHTVTAESEQTVMAEAFGGRENKAAYMLVYTNEYVRSQQNLDLTQYIPGELLQDCKLQNHQFSQLRAGFMAQKNAQLITQRFNQRVKKQASDIESLGSILNVELLNFPIWLTLTKRKEYADWLNLNQLIKSELGSDNDLKEMSTLGKGDHNPIYTALMHKFTKLVDMTNPEKAQDYDNRKALYKLIHKKYYAITYLVANMCPHAYQKTYQIMDLYWTSLPQTKGTETPDDLMVNLLRVFLLRLLTEAYQAVKQNQDARAAIASVVAIRQLSKFLKPSDFVLDQVSDFQTKFLIPQVKKSENECAKYLEAFQQLLQKFRTPVLPHELPQTEPIAELSKEWQLIQDRDEEALEQELWTPESLCYRQLNLVQQFNLDYQVWISWMQKLRQNKLSQGQIEEILKKTTYAAAK